uniref:FYN-binding protein 1-like isoform X2 n=1 Tax=Petromyzon marinus TaxID=7757 RepID=A0AAJ7TU30_PETMA|nr:FYN-binding protein 1-like isoform X2 [Petromyzon marinus]
MPVAWEVKIMAAPDIKKLMACFNNEEAGGGATSMPQPPLSTGPKLSGSSPFFPGRGGASARGGGVGVGFTGRGGVRFGGVGGASSEVGGATDGGGSEVVSGAKFGRGGAKFGVGGASEAVGEAKMWGMGGAKPEAGRATEGMGGAKSGVGETMYEVSSPSDGAGGMGRGVAKFGGVGVAKVWGVGAKFGVGVANEVAGRAKPGRSGASNEADGGASFGGRGAAKFEGVGGVKIVTGEATDGVGGAKEGDNPASACSSGDSVGGGVKFGGGGAKFGGNRVGVASDDTGGAKPAVGGASIGVGVGRFGSAVSGATSGVGGATSGVGGAPHGVGVARSGAGGAPLAVSPLAAKLRAQIASVKSGGRTGGKEEEEEGGEKRWKRGGAGTTGGTVTQGANGGPAGLLREPAPPRKVLPKPLLLGQAPKKPARPPSVELSRFRAQVATRAMEASPPSLPVTMTLITKATVPTAQLVEENYDDVELPGPPTWIMGPALPGRGTAPPLPTPRPEVPANSTRGKAPAAEVEEQQQDVYEDFYEDFEEKSEETVRERTDREKKEAKERERRDTEMKKKYKVGIDTPALHVAVACRGATPSGRLDLGVHQGERLNVLLLTGTPEGKWVVRNETGSVGLVETSLLDLEMDLSQDIYDDVAEESRANASGDQFPSADDDETESGSSGGKGKTWKIFKGINLRRDKKRSVKKQEEENQDVPPEDDEVYDDVETEAQDSRLSVRKEDKKAEEKMRKIREREEREARKKFKLSGDLPTLSVVSLLRDLRPLGRLDLSGSKGDTFDLVQNTDEMRALCRNRLGKYGYIPREHLSQPDQEDSDIYDNLDEDP